MLMLITRYNLSPQWVQLLIFLGVYFLIREVFIFNSDMNVAECMPAKKKGIWHTTNKNIAESKTEDESSIRAHKGKEDYTYADEFSKREEQFAEAKSKLSHQGLAIVNYIMSYLETKISLTNDLNRIKLETKQAMLPNEPPINKGNGRFSRTIFQYLQPDLHKHGVKEIQDDIEAKWRGGLIAAHKREVQDLQDQIQAKNNEIQILKEKLKKKRK